MQQLTLGIDEQYVFARLLWAGMSMLRRGRAGTGAGVVKADRSLCCQNGP